MWRIHLLRPEVLPITGRKLNTPKVRRRLPKLDSHFCRATEPLPSGYDSALLLLPRERVLENQYLIGCHPGRETDECAVGANRERVSPFKKRPARLWKSIRDYRKAQDEPSTTSLLGPLLPRNLSMLSHKQSPSPKPVLVCNLNPVSVKRPLPW